MHIGIITVNDASYHPNARLTAAARARGHRCSLIDPYGVWPAVYGGRLLLAGPAGIDDVSVVLPRQGAEIGDSSLALLTHWDRSGTPVINRPGAIRLARNQFLTLQRLAASAMTVPDTVLVNSQDGFTAAVDRLGGYPVVVKPVSGRQGAGKRLAATASEGRRYLHERLDRTRGLIVQRFVPPHRRRDIRVFVIGGAVAGAMELRPRPGDFRANFHLTGAAASVELPPVIGAIAVQAAAVLRLDIAGVDILIDALGQPWIIEINYAPGFRGLEMATGTDIADRIIAHIEQVCA
jgi:ribosomal protein S6--L-glutamate ligase